MQRIEQSLDSHFKLTARGATIGTELRAGTASFLTLSYLLLVNPQILAQADISNALFATALSSAVACWIVGFFGNLPVGMAPGLGLSAYLTYGLVGNGGANALSAREALGISWWSGILVLIVCLSGATNWLIHVVPASIKHGIVVGMGLLIAMIGMVSVEMIVSNPKTLVELGDIGKLDLQLCCIGILLLTSLLQHNVQGAILLGIFAMTITSWWLHNEWPSQLVKFPVLDEIYWSPEIAWNWTLGNISFPAMGAFALICIFDISGVLFGLTTLAGLRQDGEDIPGAFYAFVASGIGTMIAAVLGSTPIIVCVECAAGIREGGKTGLTAVVMGFYFLVSIFLAPLFQSVPVVATAPVLILVGVMMMGESSKICWNRMTDALPAFLTMLLMPLTYSITNGMLFGLLSAAALYLTTGRFISDIAAWYQNMKQEQGRNKERDPLVDALPVTKYESAA